MFNFDVDISKQILGNFEKWIKCIEFSLKTTKEFNSYLSFS